MIGIGCLGFLPQIHHSLTPRQISFEAILFVEDVEGKDVVGNDDVAVRALLENIKNLVVKRLEDEKTKTDDAASRKAFMAEFYNNLPVDWNGAPEFQWRCQFYICR